MSGPGVATGKDAVNFYAGCGWSAVEHLDLKSTGIPTTILVKDTSRAPGELD